MNLIAPSQLTVSDKAQILELWNNEYPEKLGHPTINSLEAYLDKLHNPGHLLMRDSHQRIIGWYLDFIREKEIWFAIIVNSNYHGMGLGTRLLNRAKDKESELNGWVIDHSNDRKKNGDSYNSPLRFYVSNGFEILHEERLELDIISAVKIKWTK